MLCIGHRGAMGYEPENTLLSIQKALNLGVDGIELDVFNVEENLVLIHDRDLSRTTNGTGYIDTKSFRYLRSLDAGQGAKIPTLREALALIQRRAMVNIELKGSNTAELTAELVRDYIAQGWSYQDFVVSSFNHYELRNLKVICPKIRIGILIYGLPWQYEKIAQELQADMVIANLDYVSLSLIHFLHQQDLGLWVYTVNRLDDIELLKSWNVDAIITNYPDRVLTPFD